MSETLRMVIAALLCGSIPVARRSARVDYIGTIVSIAAFAVCTTGSRASSS